MANKYVFCVITFNDGYEHKDVYADYMDALAFADEYAKGTGAEFTIQEYDSFEDYAQSY